MKDEKELHEINEEELEQISGGNSSGVMLHFRCPVCGNETRIDAGGMGARNPSCMICAINTGKSVTMELV